MCEIVRGLFWGYYVQDRFLFLNGVLFSVHRWARFRQEYIGQSLYPPGLGSHLKLPSSPREAV